MDDEEKQEITVFAVNRSMEESLTLHVDIGGYGDLTEIEHIVLYHDNMKACNTADAPHTVMPARMEDQAEPTLPPHSWNVIRFRYCPR